MDPWRPLATLREQERTPGGVVVESATVFLAGSECPFTCVFCDLWRRTLDGPTPVGAIPQQIERALEELGPLPADSRIKLYNASNFFDPRAVPAEDDPATAALLAGFSRVAVESHPRLVGGRCFALAELLDGELEVAMGLETVHAEALARLNKRMTVDDFDRAARRLGDHGIAVRAFVLLGVPWVAAAEQVEWAVRSAAHALDQGARVVSLIPLRGGNGEMERLAAEGVFRPPSLAELEEAIDRALGLDGVVLADLWDLERLAECASCGPARIERLGRINLTGRAEPRVTCESCRGVVLDRL